MPTIKIICWVGIVPKLLLGTPTSQIGVPVGVPAAVHLASFLLMSLGGSG